MSKAIAFFVGLAVLLVYLWSAGPTFYWLDSSEFAAAAWGLGIAHPPGHPLASLLARICCLVPVGTISFRVSLACALQAAAAAALLTLLSWRLLTCLELLDARRRSACAALAGLSVGLSYSLWFQAVRAEVYALNLLVLVAIAHELLAWEQGRDRRRLLSAALLCGLGLCNHHLLVLLALPAFLAFVLFRRPAPGVRRTVALVLAAGLLGMCTLAYLPLRSRRLPEVDWGAPRTLSGFVWTVSARAFHQAVPRAARQSVQERVLGAGFAVLGGLGPAAAALALGGLYLLWRRSPARRGALLLSLVVLGNLAAPLLVGFDPFNPDAHGYLAVAVAFLAPGMAVLLAAASQLLLRWRRAGATASTALLLAAALIPAQQANQAAARCDLRRLWAAEETGRAQLQAPPGALLVTSFFETLFCTWALRVTSDLRPDLHLVHRHLFDDPGYLEDLRQRDPELGALAQPWAEPDGPRLAHLDRVLLVEPDLDLPAALEAELAPEGLLLRWRGPRSPSAVAQHLTQVKAWRAAAGTLDDNETRRTLTWIHFTLARFACRQSLPQMAVRHLAWAGELAPQDQRLDELRQSCWSQTASAERPSAEEPPSAERPYRALFGSATLASPREGSHELASQHPR